MTRADIRLVELGLAPSRAKAQAEIAAGLVFKNGTRVSRPSETVGADDRLTLEGTACPWVSRGGLKLAHALDRFALQVEGRRCLDIGASTGGFTHVLLARGAHSVVALDVGHGQLNETLRCDPRVKSLEGLNARDLAPEHLPWAPDLIVADVSFVSLRIALAPAMALAAPGAALVALIKPQFEAGRESLKKGIVRDAEVHTRVRAEIAAFIAGVAPWRVLGDTESPVVGQDGNHEFLIAAERA